MSATKSVQRHRTIPMTKRDSISTSGSRQSLTSNNPNASHHKHSAERDQSSVSSGQKRSHAIKRTNSYRIATERDSVYEIGDEISSEVLKAINNSTNGANRQKYNTLPLRREDNNNVICKHHAENERERQWKLRSSNLSNRSGAYPSSDTDDDHLSVQPERKKKSAFKRFKERLVLALMKDDKETQIRKEKKRLKANRKGTRRKNHKSDKPETKKQKSDINETHTSATHSSKDRLQEEKYFKCEEEPNSNFLSQDSPVTNRKGPNIFKSLRDSFRRKSSFENQKQGSTDPLKKNGDVAQAIKIQDSDSSHPVPSVGHSSRGSEQLLGYNGDRNTKISGHGKNVKEGNRESAVNELDETFGEAGNLVTDIFGAIINPNTDIQYASRQRHTQNWPRVPDRSHLRLEGLRTSRPKSIEHTPSDGARWSFHRRSHEITTIADVHRAEGPRQYDLSPDVEFDGSDYADGVTNLDDEQHELSDAALALADPNDQKRKNQKVAQCLKIIADKMVEEKVRSVTEEEIVKALREIADEIDRTRFQGKEFPIELGIPRQLIPVMKNIIAAETYASFTKIIQQEISKTIGWEQVAWYTFLTKSALHITGLGRQVGQIVRKRSVKYFNSKIRPWVESRPYGWESIHEDTDIESELD